MTNRLELNWSLDGLVDEQRYYCSEAEIDPLNLPAAKATLAGDIRTFIDTQIEPGKKYYVRISSVRNGVEKISLGATVNTTVDGPRNIAIVTDDVGSTSPVRLKSVLQSFGHTVQLIASSAFTLAMAQTYDLIVGSRTSLTQAHSDVIAAAFNLGIPVLCSNHAGSGVSPQTLPTRLRLIGTLTTAANNNSIYYLTDYENIFLNAGISSLPQSAQPYSAAAWVTYSSGSVASGGRVLAQRSLELTNPSIVVAEKGSLDLDGAPFPAKIAFMGSSFTNTTVQTNNVINETIKWLTR